MANSRERVSLVIPAYNEADTIGPVLDVVRSMPDIDQVIVVSDGSTDATAVVARTAGARVVELPTNQGKGAAMLMGVEAAQGSDVIVFLDADLVGLTAAHVRALLEPVLSGEVEATVGVFEGGRVSTDLALALAPFLSGQRALRRHLMEKVAIGDSRFGVELALNRALKRRGVSIREVVLQDLSQVMKEEKMGLAKGLAARMRMYWEIIREIPRI